MLPRVLREDKKTVRFFKLALLLAVNLALALNLPAATLIRMACGGPGGTDSQGNVWSPDASFQGGTEWPVAGSSAADKAAMASMAIPYRTLRYTNPAGSGLSYTFQLPPGYVSYSLTLKFVEPNKTGSGQRIFSVFLNGAAALPNLDLFAVAPGALKPYDATFPIPGASGQVRIDLPAVTGNAVISAIQIDGTPAPPPVSEYVCGDGLAAYWGGSLFPSVYDIRSCENMSDHARQALRVRCRADGAGGMLDVMALNSSTGQLQSLLAAPIPCTDPATEVAGQPGMAPMGQDVHWMIRVNDTSDPKIGIAKFVTAVLVLQQ
jgi:hypothetical protein